MFIVDFSRFHLVTITQQCHLVEILLVHIGVFFRSAQGSKGFFLEIYVFFKKIQEEEIRIVHSKQIIMKIPVVSSSFPL